MEDFKNNPQLQEDYFEYYAKEFLYNEAKKSIKGPNPLKLSLEEAGAMFHWQDSLTAKKTIKTGVLPEKTKTNVSGNKYLEVFNKTLEDYSLQPIESSQFFNDDEKQSVIDNFKKENEKIDNMQINSESKEKLRRDFYQRVVDNGQTDIINDHIKEQNNKTLEEKNKRDNLQKVLEGATVNRFKNADVISFNIEGKNIGDIDKAMNDYPDLFKGAIKNTQSPYRNRGGTGKWGSSGKQVQKGNVYIPQFESKRFSQKLASLSQQSQINITEDDGKSHAAYNFVSKLVPDFLESGAVPNKKTSIVKGGFGGTWEQEIPLIDKKNFKKKTRSETWKTEEETKTEEPKKESKTKAEDIETKKDPETNLAEDFFKNELALGSMKQDNFNYQPGKKELPVDAIMGMALGLIGNSDAKKAKIPLRTEEVSDALKNYTADLAAKSKEGLPVEVEAAMKGQLADAYQGGLANIVNASSGNRATVLGNLGGLEQAKNKGLIGIQVADYEAKDRAFTQYGQALQYINEFDARRDIANHGIKYTDAMREKMKGERLSEAGFSKLIEALKYERENGPGSVNDQYRSLLMQKMFGFDPKMPDDGKGTTPGTKSYYETQKGLIQSDFNKTLEVYDKYGKLNPNQKTAVGQFVGQNTNKDKIGGFIDYLSQNPDLDPSGLKMENLDLALEDNDFSKLTKNRRAIIDNVKPVSSLKSSEFKIPELATTPFNPEEQGLGLINLQN
jgi:hypothetical protein